MCHFFSRYVCTCTHVRTHLCVWASLRFSVRTIIHTYRNRTMPLVRYIPPVIVVISFHPTCATHVPHNGREEQQRSRGERVAAGSEKDENSVFPFASPIYPAVYRPRLIFTIIPPIPSESGRRIRITETRYRSMLNHLGTFFGFFD